MIDFGKEVKISFVCPSYRRPYCRTAHYIPETRVYVDGSEYDEYAKENNGYGEIIACPDGVQGNLPRVRNYILNNEFKSNKADIVVMMDDDVEMIGMFKPKEGTNFGYHEKRLVGMDEIKDFIIYGSVLCQEWGYGMWGVNHSKDKMLYRHYEPFYTLHSISQFVVFIKDDIRYDERLPLKEDFDMYIQQCNKYRGCLMIAFAWIDADMGGLNGGTSIRRNWEREYEQYKDFRKKWGTKIVIGVQMHDHHSHESGERKKFVDKYDFSHPRINIPIDGI